MKGYKISGGYRKDLRGWWSESERHRLARYGVKGLRAPSQLMGATLWNESVRKMPLKTFLNSDFDNDGVPNKFDKYPFNPVNYRYNVDFAKTTKNNATFKNKKFYVGVVNMLDGVIENVYSFEKAEENDFHHHFYMSDSEIEGMEEGRLMSFWVKDDGSIESYIPIPQEIKNKIFSQIKI